MGFDGKVNNFFTSLLVAISNIISPFIAPLMASDILFFNESFPLDGTSALHTNPLSLRVHWLSLIDKTYNSGKKIATCIRHFFLQVPRYIVIEIHHRFFEIPKAQGTFSLGKRLY